MQEQHTTLIIPCVTSTIDGRYSYTLLEMSCKIMQDLPGQTLKNRIRIFLQDLERFLQESYKICKKRSKILPDSCQILAKILHDISSRVNTCAGDTKSGI